MKGKEKRKLIFQIGSTIPLLGRETDVVYQEGNQIGYDGKIFYMPENINDEQLQQALICIYKHIAKKVVAERVSYYSRIMGVQALSVKINTAKTRFGSCSGKNRLNFTYRLAMADISLIDYVVVHELAHIQEHNHSKNFWAIVENILPDYKEREKELKKMNFS